MYNKGIAKGSGNNSFKPNNNLKLEELVTFMGRLASVPASKEQPVNKTSVNNWSGIYMSWAVQNGMITGNDSGQEILTVNRTNDILKRFSDYLSIEPVQAAAKKTLITRGEVSMALSKLSALRDKSTKREVTGGAIQGYISANDKSIQIYKAIPYAAAPLGDLRWKAPQPVKPWSGVRRGAKENNTFEYDTYVVFLYIQARFGFPYAPIDKDVNLEIRR